METLPTFSLDANLSESGLNTLLPEVVREAVPAFLIRQRWFGDKSRMFRHVSIASGEVTNAGDSWIALTTVRATFTEGPSIDYFIPLFVTNDSMEAEGVLARLET